MRTDLSNMTEEEKLEHRRQKGREKAARWRAANPEKHREQGRTQYWKDPIAAREKSRAYHAAHPEIVVKRRAYNTAYAREHRAKNPLWHRERALKRNYGITLEQYDQMLGCQSGACGICKRMPEKEKYGVFHVDHDHETQMVRGLLCHRCNTGIGLLNGHFAAAQEYMKNPPAIS